MVRNPVQAARRLLAAVGNPFPVNPLALATSLHLPVYVGPLVSVDGLLQRDRRGWHIVISDRLKPARANFTLAHEIGHYLLHRHRQREAWTLRPGERGYFERQANRFAAALLMPSDEIYLLAERLGADAARLAEACGVSRQAMAIRLEQLGLAPPLPVEPWIDF